MDFKIVIQLQNHNTVLFLDWQGKPPRNDSRCRAENEHQIQDLFSGQSFQSTFWANRATFQHVAHTYRSEWAGGTEQWQLILNTSEEISTRLDLGT